MVEGTLEASAQILVVEDESEIRELISLLLLRQGHRVDQCGSVSEALSALEKGTYDLMVLDWKLPHLSGLELLKCLPAQRAAKMPVLMVTAKSEPQDIVQGLEAGADDYITKPFEPAIFSARVRALLRRLNGAMNSSAGQDVIRMDQLSINLATYEVSCSGEPIHLTPSEFKILSHLAAHRGRVLTRDQLIEVVQGEGISVTGRTVDTHVFGLRKKIAGCSDLIETIRGVGYRVKG